jgi:hypothetical protein
MNRAILASFLGIALLFAGACKTKTDEKEAIRAGVVKHLAAMQGLNVPNMEVNVTQYTVNGDQATAQVEIRAKGGDSAGGTMNLSYSMEKRDGEWAVIKGVPAGGTIQHPAAGEMPSGPMPPGHPGSGGAAGQVHPNFSDIMKGTQPPAQQPPAQQPAPANPPPTKP